MGGAEGAVDGGSEDVVDLAAGLAGRGLPIGSLFSRRLRWSLAGLVLSVLGLAVATWLTGDDEFPLHAAYLTLLDLFAIGDPALGEPTSRQALQLLSGLTGLFLLPVLLAAVLEGLGTFRTASALRRPPRGLPGHVVLLGLGKAGTRVLTRLHELGIPVVCVEEDPDARGIPLARRLRVPTVLAALYARSIEPRVRVALRLYCLSARPSFDRQFLPLRSYESWGTSVPSGVSAGEGEGG